jgi:periplasmic divalent cation tolerance protein
MQKPENIVVFITTGADGEAHKIASLLLEKKLAACVNVIPQVESSFWWQGKIDSTRESLLLVKTQAALLPEIIKSVRAAHSNEVPEIIAIPIIGGNTDYLDWINKETMPARGK